MEKTQRKILIAIMLIIILVIICITILLIYFVKNNEDITNNKQETAKNEYENVFYEIDEIEVDNKIRLVDSQNQYYSVKSCIENYYQRILNLEKQKVYDILDTRYIQDNAITQENIIEKENVGSFTNKDYIVKEMYIQETEEIYSYYINGYLQDQGKNADTYFIVFVDQYNATYSIYPIKSEYYKNIITLQENINVEEIEKNENNVYITVTVSDVEVAQMLLKNYQYLIENDIKLAYEKLDNQYRTKKFSNVERYTQYINNIGIKQAKVMQYQKSVYNDYTQYVILDENGRYYIFKESSVMNYSVLLDMYTVELQEFTDKYNSAKGEEKVQYNLQLWFSTINDGDYSYAYSKLDQTYKNNNFPTQTDFENYMKTNFYAQNKLGYTSYEKNGDLYIYKMVITNGENSSQTIEKQFVVKLLDGTNFVMSFEK